MATLITPDGRVTEYRPWESTPGSAPRTIRFDEIQEAVGGYVEPCFPQGHGPSRPVVLVHADAKFQGKPINHKAVEVLGLNVMQFFGGVVAGPVLMGLQKEFQL